jgi:predicted transcriptional regulator
MARKKLRMPTAAELEVLQVLWELGTATVKQVHERLPASRAVGYTTVLKTMQIMLEKGLVRRRGDERAHVYEAGHTRDAVERMLVEDLVTSGLQGSTARLVMHALALQDGSADDLAEVEQLVRAARLRRRKP